MKVKGILGTVLDFTSTNEEQGRNTLHSHWQIWTEELNHNIQHKIFDNNPEIRANARQKFFQILDQVMLTTFADAFKIRQGCDATVADFINNLITLKKSSDQHFTDKTDQTFRDVQTIRFIKFLRDVLSLATITAVQSCLLTL